MDVYCNETEEIKISIGGIKFSPELVQYTHYCSRPAEDLLIDFFRCLTEQKINLPFLCACSVGDGVRNTFCLTANDAPRVEMLLNADVSAGGRNWRTPEGVSLRDQMEIIRGVGTLTLFPHRRSLILLGRVIETLGESGITIHSLCTSISALAININYLLLDQAVEELRKIVELPNDHAPFRPEFCVRQISP